MIRGIHGFAIEWPHAPFEVAQFRTAPLEPRKDETT